MDQNILEGIEVFSELLDRLCPRHARNKQVVNLENDTPEYVRLFWEKVLWSDAVGGGGDVPQVVRPEREASRLFMNDFFESWFEKAPIRDLWKVEANDFSLAWQKLPSRFRIIVASKNSPSLLDESTGESDPPVITIEPTKAGVIVQPYRFVDKIVRATMSRIMVRRNAGVGGMTPTGKSCLGTGLPELWELANGVWGIDERPIGIRDTIDRITKIFYEQFNGYTDFVLNQPDEVIHLFGLPAGEIFLLAPSKVMDPLTTQLPGFRRFVQTIQRPTKTSFFYAVGYLEGYSVWLRRDNRSSSITLTVAPKNVKSMRVWLKNNRIKLDELPAKSSEDMWAINI